ncbi:hypothetical protein D3C78_1896770 [compost metagenome]
MKSWTAKKTSIRKTYLIRDPNRKGIPHLERKKERHLKVMVIPIRIKQAPDSTRKFRIG